MNSEFSKNGFIVIRGLFEPEYMVTLQTYFDLKNRVIQSDSNLKRNLTSSLQSGDVTETIVLYCDTLVEATSLLYGPAICQYLDLNLSPSYTYTRIYEKGNILLPHTDRGECEISLTCPVSISDNRSSTIFISNYEVPPEERSIKNLDEIKFRGDYSRIDLLPGDALVYSGCNRYHWREPLESDELIQFFMHYVITDGEYADRVFDGRPYMGFPENTRNINKR